MTDLKRLAARLEKIAYDEKLKLSDDERNDILTALYELNAVPQADAKAQAADVNLRPAEAA